MCRNSASGYSFRAASSVAAPCSVCCFMISNSSAGRLTAEEFEIMKQHTLHGAATLEAALKEYPEAEFLHMARDVALCHHEWFNGKGYPRGLRGEEIPLCGRIISVAD